MKGLRAEHAAELNAYMDEFELTMGRTWQDRLAARICGQRVDTDLILRRRG